MEADKDNQAMLKQNEINKQNYKKIKLFKCRPPNAPFGFLDGYRHEAQWYFQEKPESERVAKTFKVTFDGSTNSYYGFYISGGNRFKSEFQFFENEMVLVEKFTIGADKPTLTKISCKVYKK